MDAEEAKVVRIGTIALDSKIPLHRALQKIKGISFMTSHAICLATGFDSRIPIGKLNDAEIKKLEDALKNPPIPEWMCNRRFDMSTGKTIHLTGSNLQLVQKDDINLMKKIGSYKGVRHILGLPARGQRTRSSFRKNRAVGVSRKKVPGAKPKEEK